MRLGYGGGFYDLTLRKLKGEKPVFAVGVGFANLWGLHVCLIMAISQYQEALLRVSGMTELIRKRVLNHVKNFSLIALKVSKSCSKDPCEAGVFR
jgi:hypothetical protein